MIVSAIGFCAKDVGEGEGCGEDPDTVATSAEAAKDLEEVLETARSYHEAGWLKALLVYTRNYGGWSLQLAGGELTKQGEALERFADAHTPIAPSVGSISANSGPAAGGTTVTITGNGFSEGASVRFGGTPAAEAVVNSWTSITAKSPPGTGTVDITVSDAGGTSTRVPADQFAYDPVPSGPWLGVDGNSADSWTGQLGEFAQHDILFDAGGDHAENGYGIDFEAGEIPAKGEDLERAIDAGMVPLVRIEFDGYFKDPWGSDENFPHTTQQIAEYAEGFVKTAKAIRATYPGKQVLFEVMNNAWGYTTPQSNGAEYANVVAKVLPEARAAGIPPDTIYVFAFGRDLNAKEEWTAGWVPSMYEADPSLETEVQGWSFHPFGAPTGTEENDTKGIESVPAVRKLMTSGENNVIIGSIGFCAKDVLEAEACSPGEPEFLETSAEAAKDLEEVLETARTYREEGWLRALLVYTRNYGGWSLQLASGALTKQGEALERFADAEATPVTNTAAPSISGTAQDGRTLTAGPGSWSGSEPIAYAYQWESCGPGGGNCQDIEGATGSSYTLDSGDLEGTVRVRVTATNPAGPVSAVSAQSAEVVAGPPIEVEAPTITGFRYVGKTLTAEPGRWNGTEPQFSYQWERCNSTGTECAPVLGATGAEYVPGEADAGSTLRVRVGAANQDGSFTALSAVTATVGRHATLLETEPPSLSGAPQVGQTLTVSPGAWIGSGLVTYAYQWQRCNPEGGGCTNIKGETGLTYMLSSDDMYSVIRVLVTATAPEEGLVSTSASTSQPIAPAAGPTLEEAPTVSGTPIEGQTLQVGNGEWTGVGSVTYEHEWLRCSEEGQECEAIEGATGNSYTLQADDVGHAVAALVAATDSEGTMIALTAPTAVVDSSAPRDASAPSVAGRSRVGVPLEANPGIWTGEGAIAFSYQWQRCNSKGEECAGIEGATEASYTPVSVDAGHTLEVSVTATNAAGKASNSSAATGVIVSEPLAPEDRSAPSVEGPPTAGQTLTANPGVWGGTEPLSYSYQWQRCDEAGEECVAVEGATAETYALPESDVGATLRVVVKASNAVGSSEATSAASELVGAPGPPAVGEQAPSIHGDTQVGQKVYAENGDWTGSRWLTFHYQWKRCNAAGEECASIEGATSSSYTIASADADETLRVEVTATNSLGSASATSAAAAVAPEGQASTTPAIEAVESATPSVLAPAESAYLEGQTVRPQIANAEEMIAADGGLTSSTISKETPGEFAVNTSAGETSLMPINAQLNATMTPTIVNGSVAAYADVYPETDAFVRPTPLGATTVMQLRSSKAPTSFSWEIGLGSDQQLEKLPNGEVAMVEPEAGVSFEGELPSELLEEPKSEAAEAPAGEGAGEHEAEESLNQGLEEEGLLEKLPAAPETATPPITPKSGELHPQETTAEYEHASNSMQSAQDQTGNTTIMVIQAPQVLDKNGNVVPATLSVDGNMVTLTITPGESTVYPASAELAVAAPTDVAIAAKPHVAHYGFSDDRPESFAESEEKGAPVQEFDKRLKYGPLKVKRARKVLPWNTKPDNPEFLAWLEAVKRAGLTPYITIGECYDKGRECRTPPNQEYLKHVAKLMKALVNSSNPNIPPVRIWGTYNEPRGKSNQHATEGFEPKHRQPEVTAQEAAELWGETELAAREAQCLHSCVVVAGEFSGFGGGQGEYIRKYAEFIKNKERQHNFPSNGSSAIEVKPHVWGMHDYKDLEQVKPETKNKKVVVENGREMLGKYRNVNADGFIKMIHRKKLYPGAHIWMSEEGVLYHAKKAALTPPGGNIELARLAAKDFLRLGEIKQVEWTNYYQYRAQQERGAFDSALLSYSSLEAEGEAKEPWDWRPAYCVLALSDERCMPPEVNSGGAVRGSTSLVTILVDPEGLPTKYWVEYGPTTPYGSRTEVETVDGIAPRSYTVEIPCHVLYRAVAESEASKGVLSVGKNTVGPGCLT